MAQYSRLIITKQGQELVSRALAGTGNGIRFTKICVSAAEYKLSEAEELTELADIRQTALVSHIEKSSEKAVTAEAAFTNEELAEGYYMRTIGLYAESADGGEILYAVTIEETGSCYMPPYNGVTVSGAVVNLIAAVGNSESISLERSSAAVATINDVKRLEQALTAHNADPAAHGSILGNISRLSSELATLKLKIDTNITANPFSVTFETLDGLNVEGVHNTVRGTIDF